MDMEDSEGEVVSTRTTRRSARIRGDKIEPTVKKATRGRRGRASKSAKVVDELLNEEEQEEEVSSQVENFQESESIQNPSMEVPMEEDHQSNGMATPVDMADTELFQSLYDPKAADGSDTSDRGVNEGDDQVITCTVIDAMECSKESDQYSSPIQGAADEAEDVPPTVIDSTPMQEPELDSGFKRKLDEMEAEEEAQELQKKESGPSPAKKPALEINIRKLLPDLERYWKSVEDDPNDFTAWTYLLQYVDQENELLAAREAYDSFLARYPYCYGYWKKYADYEKRKGSAQDCEQVFQRGLKAIHLSVDLWIHYLNYVKAAHESSPEYIRSQFEAALSACGMEFRSDKLWEHYIHWEKDGSNFKNTLALYDRIIQVPTQSYQVHFQNLKDFVNVHSPADILNEEEFASIKAEVTSEPDAPESEEDILNKIRAMIVSRRAEVHKATEAAVSTRWTYEEAIKRPYFHVKPLEKGQLKMWKEYLQFEIQKGDEARILTLFERCLIACALYEEYWIKYVKYLTSQKEPDHEKIKDVFRRACAIHHPKKPWINMHWAAYEESRGNHEKAMEVLQKLLKFVPDSIHVFSRLVNLKRRLGLLDDAVTEFEKFIEENKGQEVSAHVSIKLARFVWKQMKDYEKSKEVLKSALGISNGTNAKVIMALVDLGLDQNPVDVDFVIGTLEDALKSDITDEQKVTFAHRKIEFLEDYGPDIKLIELAQEELQMLAKQLRDRKSSNEDNTKTQPIVGMEDTSKAPPPVPVPASNGSGDGFSGNYSQQQAYGQQYNQYGNYSNWNYQQPGGYNYGQQGWSAYQGYYA